MARPFHLFVPPFLLGKDVLEVQATLAGPCNASSTNPGRQKGVIFSQESLTRLPSYVKSIKASKA